MHIEIKKANSVLSFLKCHLHNIYCVANCNQQTRYVVYIRPILEYALTV